MKTLSLLLVLGGLMMQSRILAAPSVSVPAGLRVKLGTLRIGNTVYSDVTLLSVNARTIVIAHSGGLASIRLRDLPHDLQTRFGYDPAAEAAADAALEHASERAALQRRPAASPAAGNESKFETLLRSFGQPPEIRNETDLRPRFFQLALDVKNQGRRPSCAVFAVVSALEYQNAEVTGQPEKFSEEYLIWATRKTLQRSPPSAEASASGRPEAPEDSDEGFSLSDVALALRVYGIHPQSAMPNAGYRSMDAIPEPSPEVIEQAHTHRRVFVHFVPGHDAAVQIDNIIQALNAGVPVAIGLRWPNFRAIRDGLLSEQAPVPGAMHAVTLVGYRSGDGGAGGVVFLFKNSYGPSWGEGGYGRVTSGYLRNHLLAAAVLEVQAPAPAP